MADYIPSRDVILKLIRSEALTGSQLRGRFNITKKHKLAFKAVLAEMVEEGILGRNAKKEYLPAKARTDQKPNAPVYDGRPAARHRKMELEEDTGARVHKGILVVEDMQWSVRDLASSKLFRIPNRKSVPGKPGQTVIFELYPHPKHRFEQLAKVIANLESYGTFEEIKRQFHENFDLPPEFPPEVEEEIKSMAEPTAADFAGRVDYRKQTILCIDPLGARDHDDAISIERTAKGYKLGVHIADVSFYVKEDGPLDNQAIERSFTQYLPWCAVPMLPEKLSAELCSLNEGVDRLAFTCMMVLDDKARVQSYEFHRSVINVTRSVTYEQAMELYEQKDPEVVLMAQFTRLLKAQRVESGLLELGSTEYKVEFDDKGEPANVVPRSNVESNSWIEECMLIANQCCAKDLDLRKLHGIFRIHEAPDLSDIIELATAEPELVRGCPVNIKDLPPSKQGESNLSPEIFKLYQYMVQKAYGINPKIFKILRSMQKAHYDSNSFGHFALNWQDYAHFTSPIRRYADLWCHRELGRIGKEIKARRKHDVAEVASLISTNEVKNQKCERSALKVCTAWMLKDRVGDTFYGTINGMEEWGIFVTLDSPPADGLVRFRELPGDDYWFFNREKACIVGRRSRKAFFRGDRVEVQLLRVNPQRGEIDLAVLGKLERTKTGEAVATAETEPQTSRVPWDALGARKHKTFPVSEPRSVVKARKDSEAKQAKLDEAAEKERNPAPAPRGATSRRTGQNGQEKPEPNPWDSARKRGGFTPPPNAGRPKKK